MNSGRWMLTLLVGASASASVSIPRTEQLVLANGYQVVVAGISGAPLIEASLLFGPPDPGALPSAIEGSLWETDPELALLFARNGVDISAPMAGLVRFTAPRSQSAAMLDLLARYLRSGALATAISKEASVDPYSRERGFLEARLTLARILTIPRRTQPATGAMLAVWGDLDPISTAKRLEIQLRDMPRVPHASSGAGSASGDIVCVSLPSLDLPVITIGQSLSYTRPEEFYAAHLIAQILGGGVSSRLSVRLRTSAYTVEAKVSNASPHTVLLRLEAQTDDVNRVRGAILEEIERIRSAPVSPEELRRAGAVLRSRLALEEELMGSRLYRLGCASTFGYEMPSPESGIRYAARVSPSELLRSAAAMLRPAATATVLVSGRRESLCRVASN